MDKQKTRNHTNTSTTTKLKMQVDPSLLGGFVVRTGTTVIDTSLKYQIEKINRLFDV